MTVSIVRLIVIAITTVGSCAGLRCHQGLRLGALQLAAAARLGSAQIPPPRLSSHPTSRPLLCLSASGLKTCRTPPPRTHASLMRGACFLKLLVMLQMHSRSSLLHTLAPERGGHRKKSHPLLPHRIQELLDSQLQGHRPDKQRQSALGLHPQRLVWHLCEMSVRGQHHITCRFPGAREGLVLAAGPAGPTAP